MFFKTRDPISYNDPITVAGFTAVAFRQAVEDGRVAHVCMDVQGRFINQYGESVAAYLGKRVIPALREHNIPTFLIYMNVAGRIDRNIKTYHAADIIDKTSTSSFHDTTLDRQLKTDQRQILLLSGFVRGRCVIDSFEHAVRLGYEPILMDDCTNPVAREYKHMQGTEHNPHFSAITQAKHVLSCLSLQAS